MILADGWTTAVPYTSNNYATSCSLAVNIRYIPTVMIDLF